MITERQESQPVKIMLSCSEERRDGGGGGEGRGGGGGGGGGGGTRKSRAKSCDSSEEDKEGEMGSGLRRSQSLRRRDGSWDKRWGNQLIQSSPQPCRSPWTRPGKLNNSYWEERVRAESRLPPRTPPPRRRLRGGLGTTGDSDSGCASSPTFLQPLPSPHDDVLLDDAVEAAAQDQRREDESGNGVDVKEVKSKIVNDSKVKLNIEHKHSYSSMEKKATKDEIISTKVQSVRVIQAVDETKNEEDVKDLENAEILDKNENSGNAQGAEINVQNCDIAEYNRIAECQASAAEAARASMAKLLEEQAAAAKAEETARKEVEEIKILGIEEVIKTEEDIIVKEIAVQAAKLLEEAARKEYERQVLLQKERNNERIEIEKEAFMFEAEKVTEREAVRIESEAKKSRKISKEEREQNKRRRSKVSEADRLEALREAAIIEAKRVEAAKMKVDKEKLSKQDKIEATISFENTIAATVTDKAASLEKVNSTLVVNEAVPLDNAKAKEIIDEGAILEKVDLGTVTNEVARLENVEDTIALDEVVKHEQNNVFIDSDEATRYPKDETEIATDKAKKLKEVKASRADFKIIQIKNVYNDTGTEEAARSEMVKNATETDSAERLDKMKTNNNVPELDKKQSTKDNNSLGKEEPVEIKNKENSIVYEEAVTNKDDTKGKLIGDKMEEISTVEEEVREVGGVRGAVKDLEKEVDRLRKMSPPSNEDSTGALLAATSDLTLAFTSALTSLTEVEGDHEDLPPPPPALPLTQDTQDSTDIPSPPPPPIERMETPTPAPPPRPAPPAAIIEMEQRALNTLERKIETQYKKYPRQCESSPVQAPQASPSPQASPAPAPPQRNSSLPCTPRTNRKVTPHTVRRTPSPSRAKPLSPDSPHTSSTDLGDRAASGMYEAVPVYIGDSPVPSINEGRVNGSILEGRRAFVDSMLRAEQVSMMVTAKMEGVRQHGGKEWRDFQEGDKKAERAIAGELEKRHKEAEEILRKKKEEEHLKRLEFEEERIKQENEKMKKDAEEKRKRDLEDARLQEMLKLKEEVQKSKSPAPIIIKKEPVDEETPEEKHHRREEEIMIKVGREEHFKELEKKKKLFEDKPETIKAELVEKSKEKPAHKEIRLGTIEEYIRPASAKVISKNSITKEAKTVAVVEDREEGFSSFAVFQANKQIQKPKYQTFSDQSRNTENSSSSTSTSSRRWHNVNTGLVKDRSNLYLPQESVPSQEPSPRPLKKIFGAGRESELDSEAPWRRSEPREDAGKVQPRVALLGVMVEREGKEQIPVSREWSPGQSLVEELTLTMAELEALGAREEGGQANVVKCEGGGIKEVNKEEVHKGEKEMGEVEKGEVDKVQMEKSKVERGEVQKDEVKEDKVERSEVEKGKVEERLELTATSMIEGSKKEKETEEDKNRIVTPTLETQVPPVHWCPTTMSEDSEPVREARTEARTGEETEDEDDFGYEEEFSVGIDLPQGQDTTSGNVTPIPTTGELEELSISSQDDATIVEDIRSGQGSRATPLKSLLKKPSVDIESSGDSDSDDGKISPKKVHFSEIDQVKLMSQESIASMVSSDSGDPAAAHTITMTSPIGASLPQRPGLGNVTTAGHVTTLGHVTSLLQATSLPHGTGLSSHPRTMEMAAMMADRQQELSRALGE